MVAEDGLADDITNLPVKNITSCTSSMERKAVNSLIFSQNGSVLYSGSAAGFVSHWEITNNFNCSLRMPLFDMSPIKVLRNATKSNFFVIGDSNGSVALMESSLINVVYSGKLHGDKDPITDLAFSPAEDLFVTSSDDKTSMVVDLNTMTSLGAFSEHGSDIKTVDWHPTDSLVATGGKDHIMKLWDPRNFESVANLSKYKKTFPQKHCEQAAIQIGRQLPAVGQQGQFNKTNRLKNDERNAGIQGTRLGNKLSGFPPQIQRCVCQCRLTSN